MENSRVKKKRRLIVEFTTSEALTELEAVHGLQLLLDTQLNLQKPIWANSSGVYGIKLTVKGFNRVLRAIKLHWGRQNYT